MRPLVSAWRWVSIGLMLLMAAFAFGSGIIVGQMTHKHTSANRLTIGLTLVAVCMIGSLICVAGALLNSIADVPWCMKRYTRSCTEPMYKERGSPVARRWPHGTPSLLFLTSHCISLYEY